MTLVFDLETDGLLGQATRIHCLAIYDSEDNTTTAYNDQTLTETVVTGITRLEAADHIVGHNIIGFDIPIIRRFYPFFNYTGTIIDTLILSRLYHNNIIAIDKKSNWKHMPSQLYGRHSLESYGYRLGEYKGEFSKTTDWKEWSQEMEDYCIQDVRVTAKLCDHFHPYLIGSR